MFDLSWITLIVTLLSLFSAFLKEVQAALAGV